MTHKRLMTYNWQQKDWPCFQFDKECFDDQLLKINRNSGATGGIWSALPDGAQEESLTDHLLREALKTSKIEGEILDREDVRSSLRREFGFSDKRPSSPKSEGIARIMVELHRTWEAPLSQEILFKWHRKLHAPGDQGAWRTGDRPMQVVSGSVDQFRVWYEAPPSCRVPTEMKTFLNDFHSQATRAKPENAAIWSAIVHLWFESIHPFDDGNGRIGRAVAEKAFSIGMGGPQLLGLSDAILENKADYYHQLQKAQQGNPVTEWVAYFLDLILLAQTNTLERLHWTIRKTRLFDQFGDQMNPRQTKVIARLFSAGPEGFSGGMTTRKYSKITQCSKPTATRDLTELTDWNILSRTGRGRSVRYDLPDVPVV